ncbi:hypothetical protein ACIHCQ_34205 [Streptomyces sp. NPDC052236]|uniref:hypothetical protein n=1 Tax=Streptomyces sp. NPDC052236 TaxID=3365686 RepID=UPI0037CE6BF3
MVTAIAVTTASLEMCLRAWQGYCGFELSATLDELEEHRQFMSLHLMGLAHATE